MFKAVTRNPKDHNCKSILNGIKANSFSEVETIIINLRNGIDDIEYQSGNSITKESLKEIVSIERI